MALRKDFFWGNSTSSMQTEGTAGKRGLSVYDSSDFGRNPEDWQVTVDHYHDFERDLDLMKEMGSNTYRFQISWSRVVPDGDGDFNEEGIAYYECLIDACIKRGLTPMICLYHFDMPLTLAEKYEGFLSRKVEEAFVRFGKEMMDRFADKVKYWLVFNEHNLYFMPTAYHYAGVRKRDLTDSEIFTIFHHTMLAHAELTAYLHSVSDAKMGGMMAYTEVYAASESPKDNLAVQMADEFCYRNLADVYATGHYSESVLTFTKNHQLDWDFSDGDLAILAGGVSDFIAFSYYRSMLLDASEIDLNAVCPMRFGDLGGKISDVLLKNEWDWSVDALGFRRILTRLSNQFGLPVFPIENGIGWREEISDGREISDDYRIRYHREHIQALKDAVEIDGADVLGYLGWGLIDIPASSGNIEKRYGAVYVDYATQKRTKKKSFNYLKKVFQSNAETL
jgi:6-phospho-beta-glucosidase